MAINTFGSYWRVNRALGTENLEALAARAQKQLESAVGAGVSTTLELSDIDNKRFLAASAAAQARSQVEIRKVELAAAEGRLAKVIGLE